MNTVASYGLFLLVIINATTSTKLKPFITPNFKPTTNSSVSPASSPNLLARYSGYYGECYPGEYLCDDNCKCPQLLIDMKFSSGHSEQSPAAKHVAKIVTVAALLSFATTTRRAPVGRAFVVKCTLKPIA
ncbi:hypothetical protein BGW36DRAFT_384497 [Talaromyces proteolyticus]|uniref:Uncharacterized protein n=1 Tax=Talaromyces proteolyticus TaxID=1131652 RepID=A0AAD4KRV5_9EURO|nr:uncharacterized protein BGW36DRAFT_384497 [Talaromyces proteolyticus]KAH8694172.1 hypothetical protein BGW36DRAFT_384497 [Talaromyces proteolyticus]